jgi:hypothetical protein
VNRAPTVLSLLLVFSPRIFAQQVAPNKTANAIQNEIFQCQYTTTESVFSPDDGRSYVTEKSEGSVTLTRVPDYKRAANGAPILSAILRTENTALGPQTAIDFVLPKSGDCLPPQIGDLADFDGSVPLNQDEALTHISNFYCEFAESSQPPSKTRPQTLQSLSFVDYVATVQGHHREETQFFSYRASSTDAFQLKRRIFIPQEDNEQTVTVIATTSTCKKTPRVR